MLFRIVNDHEQNTEMRDKLICINFLPESFYIQEIEGHKVLKPPFELDVEKNLPREIRAQFPEKTTVYEIVHPLNEASVQERYRHDRRFLPLSIQVVKIDCATGPGEEGWKEVKKYLEKVRPANEKFRDPEIVGDQLNWTLEAEDVPVINLQPKGKSETTAPAPKEEVKAAVQEEETPTEAPSSPPVEGKPVIQMFNGKPICTVCKGVYKNMNSLRSHMLITHKSKMFVVKEAVNG